jgi:hypothetical protein
LRTAERRLIAMAQKSNNQRDAEQQTASPIPPEKDDELEMAEDDENFDDDDDIEDENESEEEDEGVEEA